VPASSPSVRLRTDRLTSLDALSAIAAEWRVLLDRSPGATPFQSPDWVIPWFDVFAPDRIAVAVARDDDGTLVGLVPAVQMGNHFELAGSGVGDYLAPLVAEGWRELAGNVLERDVRKFGSCRFYDVPPDAAWRTVAAAAGWTESPCSVCPIIQLPGDHTAWRAALPAGLRRNLRRYGIRLADEQAGGCVTITDARDLTPALEALFSLHQRRWSDEIGGGIFGTADVRRFHRLSAPQLFAAGALRLHLLRSRDGIVGAQYVLHHGGRAYSYISGFDPQLERYSPGTLLMSYAIERAIDDGCRTFDLLRGREAYKYGWGARDRATVALASP
jgi:CelD/BcsL family acetyltransferase involved in cellulose biosynthesis